MEYSYCSNMFTQGQVSRMRAALNSPTAERRDLVSKANNIKAGVLDIESGRELIPCKYDKIKKQGIGFDRFVFLDDLAIVLTDRKMGFIDKKGGVEVAVFQGVQNDENTLVLMIKRGGLRS